LTQTEEKKRRVSLDFSGEAVNENFDFYFAARTFASE
jgi:hypothetical protein